jgi:4-hydroxy-tetrahydrodipicolinate synthase
MANPKYQRHEAKEFAREKLRGIWTAFIVPETPEFEIDEAALRNDIRRYIDVLGVGGFYVHGFYGNFWLMTMDERKRITEITIDEVAGQIPVLVRCAHQSLKETIELVEHAEHAGADMISLLGPFLADGSEAMITSYIEHVAAATNLGISLFNTSQAGYVMSPELIARLSEIPNFAALKSGGGISNTIRIRELVGEKIVVVEPGEKNLLINMLQFGQKAIFTGANMLYDNGAYNPMHDYVEAALEGDFARATSIFYSLEPTRELYGSWIMKPWKQDRLCPVARVKYWAGLNGLSGGNARPPLENMTDQEKSDFRHLLESTDSAASLASAGH